MREVPHESQNRHSILISINYDGRISPENKKPGVSNKKRPKNGHKKR